MKLLQIMRLYYALLKNLMAYVILRIIYKHTIPYDKQPQAWRVGALIVFNEFGINGKDSVEITVTSPLEAVQISGLDWFNLRKQYYDIVAGFIILSAKVRKNVLEYDIQCKGHWSKIRVRYAFNTRDGSFRLQRIVN